MPSSFLIFAFAFAAWALQAMAAAEAAQHGKGSVATTVRGHVGNCVGCHGSAEKNRYRFDLAQSRITFSVDGFGMARIVGRFARLDGGFLFDPRAPTRSSVAVSLRADEARFGDALIEAVARERFFEADRFPVIQFQAKTVERTGPRTARLSGSLTLRGVSRPLSLDVRFNAAGRHPVIGEDVAGFSARGTFRRSDFGMTLGLPGIGDEIELTIDVLGRRLD
jgi:polyisoprenoid-binding protein YceI